MKNLGNIFYATIAMIFLLLFVWKFSTQTNTKSMQEEKETPQVSIEVIKKHREQQARYLENHEFVSAIPYLEIERNASTPKKPPALEKSSAPKVEEICGLTLEKDRAEILKKVAQVGSEVNLKWTLLAIAWQESSFGLNLENSKSKAMGVFQIMPNQALALGKRNGDLYKFPTKEKFLEAVKYNIDMNSKYSLLILEYFIKVNSKGGFINWNKVWAGYFAGHRYSIGESYSKQIRDKIRHLKRHCSF